MVCDGTKEVVRLAVATRDRIVQVWRLDLEGRLHSMFSVQLDATVPKGIALVEKDIYVFGLRLSTSLGNLWVNTGISVGNPQV